MYFAVRVAVFLAGRFPGAQTADYPKQQKQIVLFSPTNTNTRLIENKSTICKYFHDIELICHDLYCFEFAKNKLQPNFHAVENNADLEVDGFQNPEAQPKIRRSSDPAADQKVFLKKFIH